MTRVEYAPAFRDRRVDVALMTVFLSGLAAIAALLAIVAFAKAPTAGAPVLTLGWGMLACLAACARDRLRKAWLPVLILLLVGIAIRIASLRLMDGVSIGSDPMNYSNLARAMIEGRGMIVDDWRYGTSLRAYFPPLYPILLAGWWRVFGESPISTLAMNLVTCLATAWMIFEIGRALGNRPAGRVAGLLFLIYPGFLITAGIPNKELLTLLLAACFCRVITGWLVGTPGERPWVRAGALGVVWGLMALTQAALALAPPVIGLALIPRAGWKRVLGLGLRATPFFVAVMAPWWIRNWMIFGSFVPFTTAAGFMVNVMLGEASQQIPPELFRLSEPERSSVMGRIALAQMVDAPWPFLKNVGIAFFRGFAYDEASVAVYRHAEPHIAPNLRAMLTPPLQFGYAALVGGAAISCWRAMRAGLDPPAMSVAFAVLLSIGIINMWFEFGERHRYILMPLLFLLAAQALAGRKPKLRTAA